MSVFFLHTILGPPAHFLRLQYGGPSEISFLCLLYAPPPQISFFACYRGATSDQFLHKIYGGPLRSVSPLTLLVMFTVNDTA